LTEADQDATDEELMARIVNGDSNALRPLVERYQEPLHGYLFRMLDGDSDAAEDCVQETLLRVIKPRKHRQPQRFKPWMFRIATNLAIDQIRMRRPLRLSEGFEPVSEALGPEAHIERAEEMAAVRAALKQLTQDSRTVLMLRFYADLTLQEIADALEIPLGTVKSRLFTAGQRMREQMAMGERYERV
jgi:RNA polymerase sigma factor (sigma-70 family)